VPFAKMEVVICMDVTEIASTPRFLTIAEEKSIRQQQEADLRRNSQAGRCSTLVCRAVDNCHN
jgi:hypothetical protein